MKTTSWFIENLIGELNSSQLNCGIKMETEVYLALFTNKKENQSLLVAVGKMYETISYSCMKYECEYKDLDNSAMKKGWKVEKKVKKISWN